MKQLLVFLFLLCSASVFAQDVIVKKDGSTILSKVLEVNASDVKYKKHSNMNGPTYTISKAEIMSINYENGDKDTFSETPAKTPAMTTSGIQDGPIKIDKRPSDQNSSLIDSYKTNVRQMGSFSKKDATYCNIIFGIASSSTISNEDLEISFPQTEGYFHSFDIEIKNKTNRVIYIDKGNCFRVINGGNSYCYYNAEKTAVTKDDGAGTFSVQRIIAIPAHSTKRLCEDKYIKVSRSNWWINVDPNEDFQTYSNQKADGTFSTVYAEVLASQFGFYKGDVKLGQVISYNENTTKYKRAYFLTYAFTESFNSYTTMNFTLYIQQVYGHKFWSGKGLDNINIGHINRIIKCDNAKLK